MKLDLDEYIKDQNELAGFELKYHNYIKKTPALSMKRLNVSQKVTPKSCNGLSLKSSLTSKREREL